MLVEQDIDQAMTVADRVYCFQEGRVSLAGRPAELTREQITPAYFGRVTMLDWLDTIMQGVLLGGLYALFATGLSLIFGIMRLVNLAHGDLIVLAAFADPGAGERLGIDPLSRLADRRAGHVRGRLRAAALLLNRTLGRDMLPPLLVTFGLSIIIQNGLLEAFTADSRRLRGRRGRDRVDRARRRPRGRCHPLLDIRFGDSW